ncbi:carboxyl transferase domain-containing protein [Amycolatopsis panacis]|uniref:carboxyl transferase domain-containing protein n=1 Tax=Amycolatopsis panacis TaxID=2340917 RepID=UPI001F239C1F|nr:carboxyl transferase domain-containing protein [Amycolatopsis panacis]
MAEIRRNRRSGRREINAADDPDAMRRMKIKEYRTKLTHPYYAAERGLVDDVIEPGRTR